MLIEEIIIKEALPVLGVLGRVGSSLVKGAKGLGRFAIKNPERRTGYGLGGYGLAKLFSSDPEAKKIHDEMEATEDEEERERLRLELEKRIKHWENDMDLLYGQGWGESVNERELTKKEERNKEHNVKQLKPHKDNFSKYGKDAESVMYAVATKQAKKGNRFKA